MAMAAAAVGAGISGNLMAYQPSAMAYVAKWRLASVMAAVWLSA